MNMQEITMSLELGLIYGIITIAIYLSYRVLNFADLTCDGSFVLGAAASSILLKSGCNPYLAIAVAMLLGSVAGLATGILHTHFKLRDLLAGILVAFMLYSINLKIMQGVPNIVLLDCDTIFTSRNVLLTLSIIALSCWLCIGYLLNTDFGLAMRSIGQNKRLGQNGGVNLNFVLIIVLMISNALIALAGALFSQHQSFADINSGIGTVIIGFAALMIGECIFKGRSLWWILLSCILGSIIYRLLISCALHSDTLGLQSQDLNLVTGLMILGVMLLSRRRYVSTT